MYRNTIIAIAASFFFWGCVLRTFAEKEIPKSNPVSKDPIVFTPSSASTYIVDLINTKQIWKPGVDSFVVPFKRLVDHFNEPFDSVQSRLQNISYDTYTFSKVDTFRNDTLSLRWLNDSTFIIDTIKLEKEPLFTRKTVVKKVLDTLTIELKDSTIRLDTVINTILQDRDEIWRKEEVTMERIIDTAYLESLNIKLYQVRNKRVEPPLVPPKVKKTWHFLPDGSKIIISEPVKVLLANPESPFNIVYNEEMPDSLRAAVQTLLSYTAGRDSILLYFSSIEGQKTPFWLTLGDNELYRYWVKNTKNDSVTIWMGNSSKRDITLILEEDINIDRIRKEAVDDVPFTMAEPEISLANVVPLEEIPVYWNYDFSSSFALSQNYLSNWSKGGENSFSSILELNGAARYTNKDAKKHWTNTGRLKYGSIITEEHGLRKNTDLIELNSQYNKVLRKKIDFSAIFYMKNQIAKGYNYPNDSVVVSKFLNPGTFTIGLGAEYKPFKKTFINFSPLSYKNTFVLDTANIDQTIHGIDNDKKAKQEMGGQLLIKNELNLFDDLNISNSVRLFSNYLDNPQNVDLDWEMNLEKQISLFFTIMLNIHMIYDDDVRFPVLDDQEQPVLLPDGSEKKVPKLQFKQFLGVTFLFKL